MYLHNTLLDIHNSGLILIHLEFYLNKICYLNLLKLLILPYSLIFESVFNEQESQLDGVSLQLEHYLSHSINKRIFYK